MTRLQADREAYHRFARRVPRATGQYEPIVGDRNAFTSLGRKTNPDRCMVGYDEVVGMDGGFAKTKRVVLGRGPTWESAFERASRACDTSLPTDLVPDAIAVHLSRRTRC